MLILGGNFPILTPALLEELSESNRYGPLFHFLSIQLGSTFSRTVFLISLNFS